MNDYIPMPKGVQLHNSLSESCDMAVGPCACGAWHSVEDWQRQEQGTLLHGQMGEIERMLKMIEIPEDDRNLLNVMQQEIEDEDERKHRQTCGSIGFGSRSVHESGEESGSRSHDEVGREV